MTHVQLPAYTRRHFRGGKIAMTLEYVELGARWGVKINPNLATRGFLGRPALLWDVKPRESVIP